MLRGLFTLADTDVVRVESRTHSEKCIYLAASRCLTRMSSSGGSPDLGRHGEQASCAGSLCAAFEVWIDSMITPPMRQCGLGDCSRKDVCGGSRN